MARVDATGAETGSINELDSVTDGAVGGTHSFLSLHDPAGARAGVRFWEAQRIGATVAGRVCGTLNYASGSSIAVWFAFNLQQTGGTYVPLARINFGAGEWIQVEARFFNFGNSEVRLQSSSGHTTAAYILADNQWHTCVFRTTANTAVGQTETAEIRIGNTRRSLTGNFASGNPSSIDIGVCDTATNTLGVRLDDVIVDSTNADIDDSRFLHYLEPESDVSAGEWTAVGAGASKAARVSDANDNTGVEHSGAQGDFENDLYETVGVGDVSSGFGFPVVYGSVRDVVPGGATAGTYRIRLTHEFDNNPSETEVVVTPGAVVTTRRSVARRTTTSDGLPWNEITINAFRLGLRYTGGQLSTTAARVLEAWAYVEVGNTLNFGQTRSVTRQIDQISARVPLNQPRAASEETSVAATVVDTDTIAASEDPDVAATVTGADDVTADEDPSTEIYRPGGGGARGGIQMIDDL